ncbi:MAG: manganese transporter [Planctomycetota bacterium]|nr:MAG: manganese transporter [Planctomycetota bacterium]
MIPCRSGKLDRFARSDWCGDRHRGTACRCAAVGAAGSCCRRLLLPVAVLAATIAGCNDGTAGNGTDNSTPADRGNDPRLRIVCTVGMVADIVRRVAGERGDVVSLMGEGVDPHLYKPTRNDVRTLLSADVVFYNGLLLEGRMTDVLTQVARRGVPVYAVTEGIPRDRLREPPEFQGHYDPHVWMDVSLWKLAMQFAAERLAELDPTAASDYRRRATEYAVQLDRLDAYVRRVIGSIPARQRYLVTAHDAFGYFSLAYDIPVRSVQGITTESEAGVDDVVRLVDFIVQRRIPAVFVESSVNPKTVEAIVAGAARRGWTVRIGGTLFSDAMGPRGTYEGTYVGMIDHNATTIARALGGEAPQRGLNGRLSLIRERSSAERGANASNGGSIGNRTAR